MILWFFVAIQSLEAQQNYIPDFGVFGNYVCDYGSYADLVEAKNVCKDGVNFLECDIILELQEREYGSPRYFLGSTTSQRKCTNKYRFRRVAWKGQFLMNKPIHNNQCSNGRILPYDTYSHIQSSQSFNDAKTICNKYYDCDIIVEITPNGRPSFFELGKLDYFNGCPELRRTQAEMGIKLRLAWWKYGSQQTPTPVNIPGSTQPTAVPIPVQPVSDSFRTAEPEPTPETAVPETALPNFPTSTTEQFPQTERTYPPDRIPTSQPERSEPITEPITEVQTFSKPTTIRTRPTEKAESTETSEITESSSDSTNYMTSNPTNVPETALPTFTRQKSTSRSTRRPVTTSSVIITTKPRVLKQEYYNTPLESTKYGCNWFGKSCKYKPMYRKLIQNVQDYEYFEIDASDFDFDAHIEFGTDREKEKWVIIFAGWLSKKSRIAERKWETNRWDDCQLYSKLHTKQEWTSIRKKIRIEILDESIRITTNKNGTWMNSDKPFEFESSKIRKEDVTHMYVGVGKKAKGNMKVKAYKYV